MVKIEKLNKYFNRRKPNQIHIINNVSLELGQTVSEVFFTKM